MHSLDDNIPNLVETFVGWNRSFSVQELMAWADDAVDFDAVSLSLRRDSRFVCLDPDHVGAEHFIPERVALRWWDLLTVRLAMIGKSRLNESQLANTMSSLYPFTRWSRPPLALVELAQRHGFVAPAWAPGFYVFPVAHLLGEETSSLLRYGSQGQLALWPEEPKEARRATIVEAVESFLDATGEKPSRVIRGREGIPPCTRYTLEELGAMLEVSRERIRQIERRFWDRLYLPRHREMLRALWCALVGLVSRPGGMVFSVEEEITPHVCFAAKCLRIPYTKVCDLVILGTSNRITYSRIGELGWSIMEGDSEELAALLDYQVYSFLERDSILRVAQAITNGALGKLSKRDKVYLALKHIGRCAHYSDVALVYNEMNPGDVMSEHNVHAVLSRCASPHLEHYGIVWVGKRGTYGLKEHGYMRPDMPLFDTVTKIVKEKYDTTGKAVHITVIVAELGRYRHEVNSASLAFATGLNTAIREVEKGYFAPERAVEAAGANVNAEDLDRVLREFRESMPGHR